MNVSRGDAGVEGVAAVVGTARVQVAMGLNAVVIMVMAEAVVVGMVVVVEREVAVVEREVAVVVEEVAVAEEVGAVVDGDRDVRGIKGMLFISKVVHEPNPALRVQITFVTSLWHIAMYFNS